MSDSEVESNSLLFKCDVCLNDYGQSRQQKFLPCLHSFCQSCLTEIQQIQHGGIQCPICRELHVDSIDVSSLPNNYFEALKKMEREKNEMILFYAEEGKKQSASIRQLEQNLALASERIEKLEGKLHQLSVFNELQDKKLDAMVQNMRLIAETKIILQQLKEQIAILDEVQHL